MMSEINNIPKMAESHRYVSPAATPWGKTATPWGKTATPWGNNS